MVKLFGSPALSAATSKPLFPTNIPVVPYMRRRTIGYTRFSVPIIAPISVPILASFRGQNGPTPKKCGIYAPAGTIKTQKLFAELRRKSCGKHQKNRKSLPI